MNLTDLLSEHRFMQTSILFVQINTLERLLVLKHVNNHREPCHGCGSGCTIRFQGADVPFLPALANFSSIHHNYFFVFWLIVIKGKAGIGRESRGIHISVF